MIRRKLTIKHEKLSIEYNSVKAKRQKAASNKPAIRADRHHNNLTAKWLFFLVFAEGIIRLIIALCDIFLRF